MTTPSPLQPDQLQSAQSQLERVMYTLKHVIIGQDYLLERLLLALLCHGHVLLEGTPGLAKTLALKTLAQALAVSFKRLQFTPDMLPSDILGTRIYQMQTGQFTTELGPIFTHFLMADEINRAPAKVQSALLEAMQEGQVTLGPDTMPLPQPFLVMATQNPLEQEGTYPLPESQLDRFLFKIPVPFPTITEELAILERYGNAVQPPEVAPLMDEQTLMTLAQWTSQVYLDPTHAEQIVALTQATRNKAPQWISTGASPRATLAIARASRALALLKGRDYVLAEDIAAVALDCTRHRIRLTFEAHAQGITADEVLSELMLDQGITTPPVTSSSPPQGIMP